jgi:hypothetical protein
MPRPKRRGPIRKIHRASGVVDIYDDRDDCGTGQEDDRASNVERPSRMVGYESAGEPIGDDDVEADA